MKPAQLHLLKNNKPIWQINPELAVIDTILEKHPDIIELARNDYRAILKATGLGRQDIPSLEQVIRGAIYLKHRGITYDGLAYENIDSRMCARFLKLTLLKESFSASTWQKYISAITKDTIKRILYKVNKVARANDIGNMEAVRMDTTAVEANIKYPTNNNLLWNCINKSHNLSKKIKTLRMEFFQRKTRVINYRKAAKKHYFKISNVHKKNKQYKRLFKLQLNILTKSINQLRKLSKCLQAEISTSCERTAKEDKLKSLKKEIENFMNIAAIVYRNAKRYEIEGEKVPVSEKIFSIHEPHTDIIVKGSREVSFGHKINLISDKDSLIIYCNIEDGNPSDKGLFKKSLSEVIDEYNTVPKSVASDGGFASLENQKYALGKNIKNIVFNKIVGKLKNVVSSKKMETILKKWRSGMEAVISNLKRGFSLRRVNWKGRKHFDASVLWSALAYNFRVITNRLLESNS